MNIIILGLPGSGKSTQAKRIAEDFGLLHISTGQVIRDLVEVGDPSGLAVKKFTDKGHLVPDNLIEEILMSFLDTQEHEEGIVLEGFPRTAQQAKDLEQKILPGQKIDYVFYINVSKEVLLERLAERAKKEGREDENPQAIAERFEEQSAEFQMIIGYFQKEGVLTEINGNKAIEEIYQEIQKCLLSKQNNKFK